MSELHEEIAEFRKRRENEQSSARQMAALFLSAGIEISQALEAPAAERGRIVLRIERLLERERLRGARRHWTYDLNRHIALKQARDHLRATLD
ncbi:hypothetical protein [Aquamicrobium sp. LC103]|uniref:hypothetical protein n=1 Tax=Aquamicrobium sp. LC103 TaxID=1120658 RepID=UPI00063EB20E|nr:hypothetical protein [Aquamicrobium sp. LC103]TKT81210.1 cytoplasmic protein [Aquamicrobium sp. LC103]